ncbi:MAG: hypothetical protein AAFY58_04310 [Planctomycetota bacterium]
MPRDLSYGQKKIVDRYYRNIDSIVQQKLTEAVSELAMEPAPTKANRLWKSVAAALAKTDADPARVARLVESRDVPALARLVGELSR